ncbi:MAG: CoA-binding protein [bacterium]|nr:CoA-binding protein [bacterium]
MLLHEGAKIIGQGITGTEGSRAAQWMLEYGTNLVAGVTPGKGGQTVCSSIPVFNTVKEAQDAVGPIDATVVFAPPMRSKDAVVEAIDAGIKLVVVIAEKVPTSDGAYMYAYAKKHGAQIIGPNTTGIINPSKKIKIGLMGGGEPLRMFQPGNVAIVSKSGSVAAEIGVLLKRAGLGVSWAVGIGGDRIIGSTYVDILTELENDPDTKVLVIFGELGGTYEERLAEAIHTGRIKKPVVAFIAGEFTLSLPSEVQFGHAGAIIEGERGKPDHKRKVLRESGASVANTVDEIVGLIQQNI